MEVCRGCAESETERLQDSPLSASSVSSRYSLLSVEGKMFFSIVAKQCRVLSQEWIYRHFGAERHTTSPRPSRAHRCGYTGPQRSKGGQDQSGGAVVRSGQRLWLDAAQAGSGGTIGAPCSCHSERTHP